MVNDGVGALMEYVGESAIPVATVHRDAGKRPHRDGQGRRLRTGREADRVHAVRLRPDPGLPGRVPDRALVYKPHRSDLARIDARYYSATEGELSEGYRSDFTLSPSFNLPELEWHPGTRTEWVTPGQVWREFHAQDVDGPTCRG